ncbi:MAG TPA: PEGA domain-containing protein, partial [Vicinamibacteria bacterium]
MTSLLIRHDGRERGLGPGDFPVPLGGPGSAVPVAAAAGPLAWLGLESGEVFVQPSPGANVRCNGARLSASHWLRDGDVLRLSSTSVEVRMRGDALELGVTLDGEANPTEPPVVLVPPPRGGVPADDHDDVVLSPIPYVPRPIGRAAPPPRRSLKWLVPVAAALVLAAGAVLLLSRLALVEIVVEPAPDSVALRGPWPVATLGPRVLAITGGYTLVAEKAGYRRLEQAVVVERGAVLRHALQPLPGRLAVETPGLAGAEVSVDGAARGTTPFAAFEVDAGERELAVRAPGYQDHRQRVAVAGRGALQSIVVTLAPLPTPPPGPPPPPRPGIVVVSSDPAGA